MNPSHISHPVYKEILKCGVENEHQMKTVFLVYLDLCEVHGWYDVRLHPCFEHNLLFLSGHPKKGCPRVLVLPLESSHVLSIDYMQKVLHGMQVESCGTNKLTMAVCDRDSSIVYYTVSDGLIPPDSPDETSVKKQQKFLDVQQRKQEVTKNVNLYLESKRLENNDEQEIT